MRFLQGCRVRYGKPLSSTEHSRCYASRLKLASLLTDSSRYVVCRETLRQNVQQGMEIKPALQPQMAEEDN